MRRRWPPFKLLVGEALARMGQIDILVNVAGVNCRKPSVEITEEDWDMVLDLNLKALFFTSEAVGRYWIHTTALLPRIIGGRVRSSTIRVSLYRRMGVADSEVG